MRTDDAPTISRLDYQPFPYRLPIVALRFELDANETRVSSELQFERVGGDHPPLVLNGVGLTLKSLAIDGVALDEHQYSLDDELLILHPDKARFTVHIVSTCSPVANTELMGLYVSGDSLFTQCEAQGFRRITWFPDRPDVMSTYRTELQADKGRFPLLLSNGNLIETEDLPAGRHRAVWVDPHPKPSYLFALVAGGFDCREERIRTKSGREALLQVYSDPGTKDRTAWALGCLERAVQWDETRFGLELDLDRFMIVAARDFNMGAMENKGLNIFNSAYVLADPETATDAAYRAIEAVIGHEYFHNWTGNRVTCRDWFQLSLKEGLTVFRDQEFSADMLAQGLDEQEAQSARAVKRIDDVNILRTAQFPEDAGPMAHPVRPESYQEITNFYTATIYEKGAEIIRMQHTLLGEDGFQAGLREYFRRHDGQAVTCDDFVDAMESVYATRNPGRDLAIFRRWYAQAGTPRVRVELAYDAREQTCAITLSQRCEPAGMEKLQKPPLVKPPLLIPFALGLLDRNGRSIPLTLNGQTRETVLLELSEESHTWCFKGIDREPVPSLLRNFSAPVIVEYERSDPDLALLARHDVDPFARWEAGQELAMRQLMALVRSSQAGRPLEVDAFFLDVWRDLATDARASPAYRARMLQLPSRRLLLERSAPMDPIAVPAAHDHLRLTLGRGLEDVWGELHARMQTDAVYSPDPLSAGRRSLKNLALDYLVMARGDSWEQQALEQYRDADNMTDRMGALGALANHVHSAAAQAGLADFYENFRHDPLVMDKWFALQAGARDTRADDVLALMQHPAFTLRNPNRARALVFQFCMNNMSGLHTPEGYDFWARQVIALDEINPEIAARLARAFDHWSRFIPSERTAMHAALERVQSHEGLSRNVGEIINKALQI